MPRLVRTPEEIIRSRGHGIYFVSFEDGFEAMLEEREPEGRADFTAWFTQNQPHVRLEEIGPSEFSGVIAGGFTGDLYLDGWTDDDIAAYSRVFEDDEGSTLDARWQVFEYPLSEYERRLAQHGDRTVD